jgi:protein TonB
MSNENRLRLLLFIAVAALHGVLILFLAFNVQALPITVEEPARVMKLTDIVEDIPPPPPPPPPPETEPVPDNAVEAIAENMIETDEVPEDQVVVAPGTIQTPQNNSVTTAEVYLSQNKISVLPQFDEMKIRQNMIYPRIARDSGIEGTVYLELFIDRTGVVQQIRILKEDPPGRGFGDAAIRAFEGITAKSPAQANGENVSVRYRYPVSFRLR